jgi:hypothetical protein
MTAACGGDEPTTTGGTGVGGRGQGGDGGDGGTGQGGDGGTGQGGDGGTGQGGQGGSGGIGGGGGSGGSGGSGQGGQGGSGNPVCVPGMKQACYSGPPGTQGVGICGGGTETCLADGSGYGSCVGEVTPVAESCASLADDDCDGQVNEQDAGCACVPGTMASCYTGPAGTAGVGPCVAGSKTCNANGLGYGPCLGEVTPGPESCASAVDDDCDGQVNEQDAGCVCAPGAMEPCYSGPPGTAGVGMCTAGSKTCNANGLGYGACMGEVVPAPESCAGAGDEDCDGQANEGGAGCVCVPGATKACYTGPAGTENIGVCKGGQQTCNPNGLGYGACVGEVLPTFDTCGNGLDDDCNGAPDNALDIDGDGWNPCNGDCCEMAGSGCGGDPAEVNPGALEVLANGDDDDCDPTTSDVVPPAACSAQPKFSGVTGLDFAFAIDLCKTTTANPPMPQKRWGLISATQLLANGSVPTATQLSNMQSFQTAVLSALGTGGVVPQKNGTMGGLSSGRMRDENDPGFVLPNGGTDFGVASSAPAAYLAAHSGALPANGSCSGACLSGTGAYDPVNVRMSIRVPTNVSSMLYDFAFFSAEYETPCSQFNDFHLALLQTTAPGHPADKNIALGPAAGIPVSANNTNYTICTPKLCYMCPSGPAKLTGTGFTSTGGAGTEWHTVDAAVVPGETIQLEIMIFDVSDGNFDSSVMVDNFRWN